jgi:hypothetical protein
MPDAFFFDCHGTFGELGIYTPQMGQTTCASANDCNSIKATAEMDEKKTGGPNPADTERKRRGDRLGQQLRQLYDDVTHESVPDDFMRLLEEADRKRASDPHSKSS